MAERTLFVEESPMRWLLASLLCAAVAAPAGPAAARVHERGTGDDGERSVTVKSFSTFEADDARFHLGKDEIVISHLNDPYEEIRITSDRRMYLDDEEIPLTPPQQDLVGEFYQISYEIRAEAKGIAKEGITLGLKGAKLGLQAVGAAMKMLFTEYDEEQFDRDMEIEAEKLEAHGEQIEKRAKHLEDMVEQWEELGRQMKSEIGPLRNMEWL